MGKATFGAGCFWGVEAAFRKREGVIGTLAGYAGGTALHPSYEQVCTGRTGHAEVVQVEYDPGVVTYGELVDLFWDVHDPTQRDRQGPDVGTQYRSAIFTHDAGQKRAAQASKQALEASGRWGREIATEIAPAGPFYRAEEYHQRYFEKMGRAV